MANPGFEYKKKKSETPFETFLRYTDEKEKSAIRLSEILQDNLNRGARVLDIGTGNGEFLKLVLSRIDSMTVEDIMLTLVEPSSDLFAQLKARFAKLLPVQNLTLIRSDLQTLESDGGFDMIIMSHLFYHIPRDSWSKVLLKTLSLLSKGGLLVIVLREKDDVYDFKMAFKPLLFDASFEALTIDDVLKEFPGDQATSIEKLSAFSHLRFPTETSFDDTVSIIEFYLNKEWADIPKHIQQSSLDFIKKKNSVFKQVDGIAVIRNEQTHSSL